MTDTVTPLNAPPADGQPTQIGIGAQYIKDLSFECPNAPHIFTPSQSAPSLDVGINVQSRGVGDHTYEVALMMKMESKIETKTAYIIELSYAGIFVLPPMAEEAMKVFLMVEAPRLLFPFARAIIAGTVRDGGFQPVVMTPIDFMAMYNANKGQLGVTTTAGVA